MFFPTMTVANLAQYVTQSKGFYSYLTNLNNIDAFYTCLVV